MYRRITRVEDLSFHSKYKDLENAQVTRCVCSIILHMGGLDLQRRQLEVYTVSPRLRLEEYAQP